MALTKGRCRVLDLESQGTDTQMSEDGRKHGQCGIAETQTTGISDDKDEDDEELGGQGQQ